jgi:thymidylate synthase (FAD)
MSKVSLVWVTPDAEQHIAYMARVSNPANQNNTDTAPKLLKYLINNKHWSPFEMVNVCMEIEVSRDIARQILRHRSFSFQEFSQRYALADQFELFEARLQDNKNRQNSIPVQDRELQRFWQEQQHAVINAAKAAYSAAINNGIAKEVARKVLPEGLTMSRMYMNGT